MFEFDPSVSMMDNANRVLENTGLASRGWTWHWNTNKTRAGVCKYGPKRLELSSVVAGILTPADTWNTVLHEIAHALTPHDNGHGYAWRKKHLELGGNGQTTTALTEEAAERLERTAKWIGTCPANPKHTVTRHRMTQRARQASCGECATYWSADLVYEWRENTSRVLSPAIR